MIRDRMVECVETRFRGYVRLNALPDAVTAIAAISKWMNDSTRSTFTADSRAALQGNTSETNRNAPRVRFDRSTPVDRTTFADKPFRIAGIFQLITLGPLVPRFQKKEALLLWLVSDRVYRSTKNYGISPELRWRA